MTADDGPTTSIEERAWRWAKGSSHAEAALLILTEAVQGSLFDRIAHCFVDYPDVGRAAPDWDAIAASTGAMSGGEYRLVEIAVSLGSTSHEISVNNMLWGLDEANAAIVIKAVAHALQVDSVDCESASSA